MEDSVVPNDENKNDESLASDIETPQTILWKLEEWREWEMKLKKWKLKEWTLKLKEWNQTMKECTTNSYPLIEKGIS